MNDQQECTDVRHAYDEGNDEVKMTLTKDKKSRAFPKSIDLLEASEFSDVHQRLGVNP